MNRRRSGDAKWATLLAHAALLQSKVPGAVLVGGTAAALHAGHRISFDHDHVLRDLAQHYDDSLAALESIVGWRTVRKVRGRMVLGQIGGIDAGLRHLRRSAPLEFTEITLRAGGTLRLPTIAEILRIKAFLLVERNATRDYLDVAALSRHLGMTPSASALGSLSELYAEFAGEGGDMLTSVLVKLALPDPTDLASVDLTEYKGIVAPWNSWRAVAEQCGRLAAAISEP
jgi:hypothetical protein